MKKHIYLSLFLLLFPFYGMTQESSSPYIYPILPGTEAWVN